MTELLESLRSADPATVRRAGRILADTPPDGPALRPVRVAVLATCTIGPFEPLLRASLVAAGTLPTLVLGDYGAFELSLTTGAFGAGAPDLVACLIDDGYFLPRDWSAIDPSALAENLDGRLAELRELVLAGLRR